MFDKGLMSRFIIVLCCIVFSLAVNAENTIKRPNSVITGINLLEQGSIEDVKRLCDYNNMKIEACSEGKVRISSIDGTTYTFVLESMYNPRMVEVVCDFSTNNVIKQLRLCEYSEVKDKPKEYGEYKVYCRGVKSLQVCSFCLIKTGKNRKLIFVKKDTL